MAQSGISLEVLGEIEARRKREQVIRDLHGNEFARSITEALLVVEADAKRSAPVDRGRLRSSIAHEVRTVGIATSVLGVIGVVGTNVKYAPYMELGTGVFVGRPRYFPPPSALAVWAKRHGANPYAVAWAIYRRGGLRPRRFLQGAFESNQARIVQILGRGVEAIVRK